MITQNSLSSSSPSHCSSPSLLSQPRRFGAMLAAGLVCVVLLASGCASSNDPSTWEEARADGTLEENFLRSCSEANAGGDLTEAQITEYCECAFGGLSDHFADSLSSFTDAERRLRSDPQDIDPEVRALLLGCVPE